MKRIITAAKYAEPELSSRYFDLVKTSGMSIYNQPWSGFEIISKGKAKEQVVEIRLDQVWANYEQDSEEVLEHKYRGCEINWGTKGRVNSDEDVYDMMEVLKDALMFKDQVTRYFRDFK